MKLDQPMTAKPANKAGRWQASLIAAILAGTLDLLFVSALWWPSGLTPEAILRVIASGALGSAAFEAGAGVPLLGLLLHFAMALIMASLYIFHVPGWLRERPWIAGPLYGAAIWLVMNLVVVPLSAAPITMPPLPVALADLAAHIFLVGLPIALLGRCRERK